tara:strand:- start:624 stop:827 length:204 start_codon:yes stop_codon:yes gene_type:complete
VVNRFLLIKIKSILKHTEDNMGCCTQEKKYDPTNQKDIAEINAAGIADPTQRIEKQFPFYRMHAKAF